MSGSGPGGEQPAPVGQREAVGRREAVWPKTVGRHAAVMQREAPGRRILVSLALVAAGALAAGCGGSAVKQPVARPLSTAEPSAPSGTSSSGTSAGRPAPTTLSAPPATDPGTLPQTHALPDATDPTFLAGARALFQAIVDDDPAEAQPFFFPQSAYVQVKAIPDPVADYQHRLVGFYDLDIHAAHRLLGADPKNARFVSVSVPTAAAKWITPGVEANKGSYYRVYGSRLIYQAGGRTKSFGLFSLISWRGVWYVVHLGPNPRPKPVGEVYRPQG